MVKASERRPVRSAMSTFRRRPRSPKMSFKVAETLFDLHAFPIQAPHRLDRWKRLTVGGGQQPPRFLELRIRIEQHIHRHALPGSKSRNSQRRLVTSALRVNLTLPEFWRRSGHACSGEINLR